ncbi:sensor histidine kinase [Aureibaculum algae]|nr:7TM diverse intracellular signaling domain-containing protein [Aureibaculum algae]
MDKESIKYIFEYPNENGILYFVLGILFMLSIYHFLLYFQHKDKSYLYYCGYTFLIFLSHLNESTDGFVSILVKPFVGILNALDVNLVWTYNMLYFIFAFTFLDLKAFSLKWYRIIFRGIYIIFFITIGFEILYRITGNVEFITKGNIFFLIYMNILSIRAYMLLFKMDNPFRYYIIVGSLFLFLSSMGATLIDMFDLIPGSNELSFTIFYFGVILENILFSLGLGHKQKLILEDKNKSQATLISQLQENEKLKDTIHLQLEENLASLSLQAKTEKIQKLKEKYDKELAELKITSLRSQMNPHFIFNSLNSIKLYIINNEKENAVYYLNKFSKLIRKILNASQEKEISLADEIETMQLYINIENIRFNNEIEFEVVIDQSLNLNTIKIPSLILQPFLENAIWHGLASIKEKKILKIKVNKDDEFHLSITITDNGIGRKKSAEINSRKIHKTTSVGIKLTEERLSNFAKEYQNDYSITFTDLTDGKKKPKGTKVEIKLPLH